MPTNRPGKGINMRTAIRMQLWAADHRPVLMLITMALLIMAVAADCGEGGWSDEGGDNTWRRS